MDEQIKRMSREIKTLKWYAAILTFVFCAILVFLVINVNQTHFKEITAERINIVEDNGNLRMVISNKSRSPQALVYGKPFTPPIEGGNRPGLIFYNDECTENGGLVFMGGKDSTGKYEATGHLSFDQYNQNQTIYLQYADDNGNQNTGLHIDDWQIDPPFWKWRAAYKKAQQLPDGAYKQKLLNRLMEPSRSHKAFAQRIFIGKNENKTAMLTLADREGKPRLQLLVDSNGIAKLNFLNEKGNITYSLPKQ